jgi:hypothetical protein
MKKLLSLITVFSLICAQAQSTSVITRDGMSAYSYGFMNYKCSPSPYSTPTVLLDSITTAVASGSPFTMGVAAPVGSLIIALFTHQSPGTQSISAVVDSVSNSYSKAVSLSNASTNYYAVEIWYAKAATALPSGGTITATSTDTQAGQFISVKGVTRKLDATTSALIASTTTVSLTSGTLACPREFVVAGFNPTSTAGVYTEATGFTDIDATYMGQAGGMAYHITSSTASVTWNPSWITALYSPAVLATFK